MKTWFSRLTLNQRLAIAALLLGVVAIGASPYQGDQVRFNAREVATEVQDGTDHLPAAEVAEWIVQGRSDFRLVDVRDEKAFAQYHIPTAENIPIAALADADLGRNETLVLYSDGGSDAAQAWFLLTAKGHRGARIIQGGLEEWRSDVLYPRLAPNPTPEEARHNARLTSVSAHFGGQPRAGGGAGDLGGAVAMRPAPGTPTVQAPKLDAAAATTAKKPAKKKEGC
jgi:rhodanese-related sulfurtransferase